MSVSLHDAARIIQAGEASAKSQGIKVSIAVVDTRGDLVALSRMDGARFFTPDVARGKAMVAAVFGQSSALLAERANSPVFQSLNQMHQGRFVFGQGGLPIAKGNEIVGGVGVSGGTSQQDEDIGKAGLAAL